MDPDVMGIVNKLSEVFFFFFFLKYLLSGISLVERAVVSGTINILLRRLCLLNKTTEILWTGGLSALS